MNAVREVLLLVTNGVSESATAASRRCWPHSVRRKSSPQRRRKARSTVVRKGPDLVFFELGFPRYNGTRIERAIRATNPSVPLVAVGQPLLGSIAFRLIAAGVTAYLDAPLTPEDVLQCVERFSAPPDPLVRIARVEVGVRDLKQAPTCASPRHVRRSVAPNAGKPPRCGQAPRRRSPRRAENGGGSRRWKAVFETREAAGRKGRHAHSRRRRSVSARQRDGVRASVEGHLGERGACPRRLYTRDTKARLQLNPALRDLRRGKLIVKDHRGDHSIQVGTATARSRHAPCPYRGRSDRSG